jgi:septal ring factor EnvC (AmiA/AmiB activator)
MTIKQQQDEVARLEKKANTLTARRTKLFDEYRALGDEQRDIVNELAAAEQRLNDLQAAEALLDREDDPRVLAAVLNGHFGAGRERLEEALAEVDADKASEVRRVMSGESADDA